jgi:hypothetical protein
MEYLLSCFPISELSGAERSHFDLTVKIRVWQFVGICQSFPISIKLKNVPRLPTTGKPDLLPYSLTVFSLAMFITRSFPALGGPTTRGRASPVAAVLN